jgi:putative ABC transport system permease protein
MVKAGTPIPKNEHRPPLERRVIVQNQSVTSGKRGRSGAFTQSMNDVRLAIRTLSKSRGLAAIAALTFALGIGANTAIFSVIYAVLLRATPYPNANRLVRIHERGPLGPGMSVSPLNFLDWKRATTSFERMSLFRPDEYTVGAIDPPIRALGAQVSADLFPMLGASAERGRVFTQDEDKPGAAPAVVIAHGFWQQRFGGDPNIVGRTLQLDAKPYTVVGIMPASFDFPEHLQFWIPAGLSYDVWNKRPRSNHFVEAVGLMKPGVTLARAQSDLQAIAADLARKYPTYNEGFGVALTNLHDDTVSNVRPALLALLAGVGFVLLIACANVANLLLARALQRKKDLAIRIALGASRGRVIRQMLGESVLLALVGGALGIGFAVWSVDFLTRLVQETLPHARFIRINLAVMAFTFAAALLTGLLAGLAPMWQSFKTDLTTALKDTGRSTTGGIERQRMRGALVIAEISLSFVLLIGAGLMLRTFVNLAAVNLGFHTDHLLTMKISLPNEKYPVDRVIRRIREVPGVQSAGLANPMPVTNDGWQDIFVQPGEPKRTMADVSWTHMAAVSPGYFEAMRIPLVSGRLFDERDGEPGRQAVIVDELFVQRYWPHDNPLGKRIKNDFDSSSKEPWTTVVGVVGHVRNSGPERSSWSDPLAEAYVPYKQDPFSSWTVAARTEGDPAAMTAAIENAIRSMDRGIPISDVRTMQQLVAQSLAYRRFSMLLLGIFAAIGLILALVGVYGVISYSVTQRLHEIGVRIALGAARRDVFRLVLGNVVKLAGIGLAAGFVLALVVSRWLAQIVFGVSSTDPGTFLSVSVLLAIAALAAGYIPARRATLIDPATALRDE